MEFDLKKQAGGILFILILAISATAFVFILNKTPPENKPISLGEVEIVGYEGADLSSINDFRENSIKGPQYIDIENYTLKVIGLVKEEKEYNYNEIIGRQTYSKVVTLNCVEGWSAKILWEGIILRELLAEARPSSEANTIIFYAKDGYSTSYPIDYIMNNDILLAYKMNNMTILPERGFPFQLVAEDKWGYKWIKWITKIEFSNNSEYRGFWESRGYANEGNLNESYYG